MKWFGFRDKSKELKKELGELRKTHDAVMVENTALVAEMAKKEQDGISDTAARLEADAEARVTRTELEEEVEEQEETLLALRSELAASAADNTALEEKVEQFQTDNRMLAREAATLQRKAASAKTELQDMSNKLEDIRLIKQVKQIKLTLS